MILQTLLTTFSMIYSSEKDMFIHTFIVNFTRKLLEWQTKLSEWRWMLKLKYLDFELRKYDLRVRLTRTWLYNLKLINDHNALSKMTFLVWFKNKVVDYPKKLFPKSTKENFRLICEREKVLHQILYFFMSSR